MMLRTHSSLLCYRPFKRIARNYFKTKNSESLVARLQYYCSNSSNADKKQETVISQKGLVLGITASLLGFASYYVFGRRKPSESIDEEDSKHERFVMPNTKNLVLFKRKGNFISKD